MPHHLPCAATPHPARRIHPRLTALALCAGLFTSGCGAGGAGGAETTSGGEATDGAQASAPGLDRSAPRGQNLGLLFTLAPLTGPDEDVPRSTVGLLLTDEAGATAEVALADLTGVCTPVDAAAGGVASFRCWWAGGGTALHARVEDGELRIYREELEEGMAEDPTAAVLVYRFDLAAGAEVVAIPTEDPL